MSRPMETLDGNEAAARIAYLTNEVCIIYPITPSSTMGELADQWASEGRKNLWGSVPDVVEMQSEAGAAGAVHGSLQAGALATTFTASQGLLLMIPNMYKIAGELTPAVFHVAARSLAAQALSIFGDHSDVMAVRGTGWAMLCAASVQEVMDFALISQMATLTSRVPFVHFFDGFRTSHEIAKITPLDEADVRAMIDDQLIVAHRQRALSPDHPVIRGTAQNPDVYFQGREAANPYYERLPGIIEDCMAKLAARTGRHYKLFEYYGHPQAERVIIVMGSGAETVQETVAHLLGQDERVGVVRVHLFRPFSAPHLLAALPPTVKAIAVLDRTKEPGAAGEPLYQDVMTSLGEAAGAGKLPGAMPRVIGGRYGLSSKEFTPAMVKAVLDELGKARMKNHFTIGIRDDVSHTSLDFDASYRIEGPEVVRCIFHGLGSDGTVGANKNSIKIIGEETELHAQGYFVYDSKKSGSRTVSHLRFGPNPIRSPWLVQDASFLACHQFNLLWQIDMLSAAAPGGVFLLNSPYDTEQVWEQLPRLAQQQILDKKLRFFVIDALKVARDTGMGGRINTVMQTCFFAICGVLPREEAIARIKDAIRKTFGKKGEEIVQRNFKAVDQTLENLHQVTLPDSVTSLRDLIPPVPVHAPDFIRSVTGEIIAGRGDDLPVSALPADGTWPVGSAAWEKRNVSDTVPLWDEALCAQCGNCALVCPHGVIRMKAYDPKLLADAPAGFKAVKLKGKLPTTAELVFTLQIAVEDCTGCTLCVDACPVKNKERTGLRAINMGPKEPTLAAEREGWEFFSTLPSLDRRLVDHGQLRGVQFLEPLFEFSGACAGCGETPYLKLLTQLFGDRLMIANATGCSSIYGGNLPTTPWAKNAEGRGPAWSNSLFEDNAEFGYGFRLTLDQQARYASELLVALKPQLGEALTDALLAAPQKTEEEITEQRQRLLTLKARLATLSADPRAVQLLAIADSLARRSVWIIGGDGWAYDIGFGGLDHVLASGRNIKILVLDTEVYSNTGGQASKSTPRGAVAKFAAGGKQVAKKDLGLIAMSYKHIYVARIAFGSKPKQAIQALLEAEAYDGPALVIAYSHCIAHGINMSNGLTQQKLAVQSGYWPLFRFNPELASHGENALRLDSDAPSVALKDFAYNELRYRMLSLSHPEEAKRLLDLAQNDVKERWQHYEKLARGG